jgi:LPXTG-site transpeptidase (sortase) family protein
MNRTKRSRNNPPLLTLLFLGLFILGTGGACWAMLQIVAQSSLSLPFDDVRSSEYIAGDSSQETNFSLGIPAIEKSGYAEYPVNNTEAASDSTNFLNIPGETAFPEYPDKDIESDAPIFIPTPIEPLYPIQFGEGESVGSLAIPTLMQKFPIIQGTGQNELKKGVGHFIQSVLPGEEDNCVLSGHRDSVFAKLGQLKIGDPLVVQTAAGKFTYEIMQIRVVDKTDKTVIVPADHAILTLTTCYPFKYFGNAPDRYIIIADLVLIEDTAV